MSERLYSIIAEMEENGESPAFISKVVKAVIAQEKKIAEAKKIQAEEKARIEKEKKEEERRAEIEEMYTFPFFDKYTEEKEIPGQMIMTESAIQDIKKEEEKEDFMQNIKSLSKKHDYSGGPVGKAEGIKKQINKNL